MKKKALQPEELAQMEQDLKNFKALDLDMEVVEEFPGKDFLQQRGVVIITEAQAARLEAMAGRLLEKNVDSYDPESLELLAEIRNIRSVAFEELLSQYPKAAG